LWQKHHANLDTLADQDVVSAAVASNGDTLQYASETLRNDPGFLLNIFLE